MRSEESAFDMLRCYCGAEVCCYHVECLAMVDAQPEFKKNHDRLYNERQI